MGVALTNSGRLMTADEEDGAEVVGHFTTNNHYNTTDDTVGLRSRWS